ncbi:MAG: glycosyltransferase family 39 protein [Actinobacteria bacterium]|nr:glycosyltransferase family 39 protein [Actinomycetota bacterium]
MKNYFVNNSNVKNNRFKIIIVILFIAFMRGWIYSSVTPFWQAPDEPFHYEYIQEIGRSYERKPPSHDRPSTQTEIIHSMAKWDFWRYQNQAVPAPLPWGFADIPFFSTIQFLDRAPLYYYIFFPVFKLTASRHIEGRVYAIRLFNVIFGIVTIFLSYLIAKEIFPDNDLLSIGTPAFIAFLPMFSYISGSISSDNLLNLFFAIFIYLSIKILKSGLSVERIVALLFVIILSFMTKRSAIIEIPLSITLIILLLSGKEINARVKKKWLKYSGIIFLVFSFLSFLIWRSTEIKAKIRSALNVHLTLSEFKIKMLEFLSPSTAYYRTLWNFKTVFRSFWAHFGWMNIPLEWMDYYPAFFICLISLIGLIIFIVKIYSNNELLEGWQKRSLIFIIFAVFWVTAIAFFRSTVYEFVPLQGRYLFPAISAISLLFILGWQSFVPSRRNGVFLSLLILFLAGFDFVGMFMYLIPRFYLI